LSFYENQVRFFDLVLDSIYNQNPLISAVSYPSLLVDIPKRKEEEEICTFY